MDLNNQKILLAILNRIQHKRKTLKVNTKFKMLLLVYGTENLLGLPDCLIINPDHIQVAVNEGNMRMKMWRTAYGTGYILN